MFDWLKNLIATVCWCKRKPKRCDHATATISKWLDKGCPMVEITCGECGYHDRGHVHADPADWVEHLP